MYKWEMLIPIIVCVDNFAHEENIRLLERVQVQTRDEKMQPTCCPIEEIAKMKSEAIGV